MGRTVHELINSFGLSRLSTTPHGYKACCAVNPAHVDRSPSMHIHLEKGLVKCFACGTFRPLFDFLIDNGASFEEAVEFLFLKHEKEEGEYTGMKEYSLGRKLPKSFIDRGFTKQTLRYFGVGYDSFEDRITIPLKFKEVLIGIQYRRYPKELWTSEDFNKFNYIYNYEQTEERTYCEGFTDCWKIWQLGTRDISATLGASPSEGQLKLMAQHKVINIAYDNDLAGYVGAFKIYNAIGTEVEVNMIPYKATDPGDCDADGWEFGMRNKTTFLEFEVSLIRNRPQLYSKIMQRLKLQHGKEKHY
jgi:DNA primase